METIKKIYAYINGNKTIICAFVWLLISKNIIHLTPEWIDVVNWVLGTATGGAFLDHVRKGFLTDKKGN